MTGVFALGASLGAIAGFATIVFLRGISQAGPPAGEDGDVWGTVTGFTIDPEQPELVWIRIHAR